MSSSIVAHRGDRTNPASLERGSFSDGARTFHVFASSDSAPDSFQVFMGTDRSDLVLVISGLNSGELKANWGPGWRAASEEWREWFEVKAFMAYYNGDRPSTSEVRVCNG